MSKSSARNGDGDKTVRSEISHGGYVTKYDNVELPNYLLRLPSYNYVIMDISVEEELNESVNDGYYGDAG